MRKMKTVLIIAVLALVGGCSSVSSAPEPEPTPTPTPAPTPPPIPEPGELFDLVFESLPRHEQELFCDGLDDYGPATMAEMWERNDEGESGLSGDEFVQRLGELC